MLQICFLLICSNSKFWNVIQKPDNEKSIGMDHTLQYCSQKLLAINMILRAKARCRGRGPSEMSFVGHWVQRDISSKKRRIGQGRPCCWCPCTRKRSPLHLLPSLLTLGWRIKIINQPTEKESLDDPLLQAYWQQSTEACSDTEKLLSLLPFAHCRWKTSGSFFFFFVIWFYFLVCFFGLFVCFSFFISLKIHFTWWESYFFSPQCFLGVVLWLWNEESICLMR